MIQDADQLARVNSRAGTPPGLLRGHLVEPAAIHGGDGLGIEEELRNVPAQGRIVVGKGCEHGGVMCRLAIDAAQVGSKAVQLVLFDQDPDEGHAVIGKNEFGKSRTAGMLEALAVDLDVGGLCDRQLGGV